MIHRHSNSHVSIYMYAERSDSIARYIFFSLFLIAIVSLFQLRTSFFSHLLLLLWTSLSHCLCQAGHLSDVLQTSDRLSGNWTSLWDANFLRMTPIMTPFSRSMRLPCNVRLSMRFGVLLRLHHRFITITLHSRFSYVSFFRIDRHPNKSFEQINHPPNTHISLVCDVRAPSLAPKQINSMLNCRFLRFCSHNEIRHSYKALCWLIFFPRILCQRRWLAGTTFIHGAYTIKSSTKMCDDRGTEDE